MDINLAAVIVHDIKNALGVLESELHNMTANPTSEQAVAAHGNCVTLRDKMIGFLTLYKASTDGLLARVDAVNPEDFLHSLVNHRITNRPNLPITIKTEGMPPLGFFDENLVGLALDAALQNATRFARSIIEIGCTKTGDGYLAITIRDDGAGLGTKESTVSTGLGTALCHVIAQAHNKGDKQGSVHLANHPDGGALFELRLP